MVKYTIIRYLMNSIDYNYLTKIDIKKLTNDEVDIDIYIDNNNVIAVINMIEANMFIDRKLYKVKKVVTGSDKVLIFTTDNILYTINILTSIKKSCNRRLRK